MAKKESRGDQVRKFTSRMNGGRPPREVEPEIEKLDLVVRGGRVVTPEGIHELELGILRGKIVAIAPELTDNTFQTLDAAGKYIFPGIIDAHVHFNEPGRAEWEGLAHGSLALAAGGGTCFFDMPLNSEPPVLDSATMREKRIMAEVKSCTDFGLWGGLVPGNLDRLAGLRDGGAMGVKAFMCNSGIDSFGRADPKTLYEGMKRAAKLGLLVAVHAEDDALAAKFTAEQKAKKKFDAKAWLASRPVEVELAAIRMALEFAGETGCALHVVHVSSPEGVALIEEARANRVDVTAETCPHYLLLNDKDVAKIGAPAKCAPPIRDEKRRVALWGELLAGNIQTVGSDHSPAPAEMKTSENFFEIWGGIGGVQHGAQLLMNETVATLDQDWPRLAAVLARNVARRFRIDDRKGSLAEGLDADFSLVEIAKKADVIAAEDLWTHHPISAYLGRKSRVKVTDTYVRGVPVWANGAVASGMPKGQFVRPRVE
ncbi:allantoinase AllB [Oleiharenicola lentus]|uniref:allantoinase AllB n=1 Tax=Oleiharenicola lentus TaxID=2508720 RepID=UPI003F674CF7